MTPDYERAAILATETLINHKIGSSPISPLPILKQTPGVLVLSYEDLSRRLEQDRRSLMSVFGERNQDAFTTVNRKDGHLHYVVTYNQRWSQAIVQRALARELGHIVLGHDGSRPEEVRNAEAICFAHHLLCPRPLLRLVQASGLRFTIEVLGNLTGCYDHCLTCMRHIPGVAVPPELNRAVRDQFKDFFVNFFCYQRTASLDDGSALVDFGTYMDCYEE